MNRKQTLPGVHKLLLALIVVAFAYSARASAATINVYAAASLHESFVEIGEIYESQHPGQHVRFNFGGSSILRIQIDEGAPVDVFASADDTQMNVLVKENRVNPVFVCAHNLPVGIASLEARSVRSVKAMANPGVKLAFAEPHVPIGAYETKIIARLNAVYGANYMADVLRNVVTRETDVRAVLTKVSLGEADAGFVYQTDAAEVRGKVVVLPIPRKYNLVASYPIASVKGSDNPGWANAFVALVRGPVGQRVLRSHGFLK